MRPSGRTRIRGTHTTGSRHAGRAGRAGVVFRRWSNAAVGVLLAQVPASHDRVGLVAYPLRGARRLGTLSLYRMRGNDRTAGERCILVGLNFRPHAHGPPGPAATLAAEESIDELRDLAVSAGAEVLGHSVQIRDQAVPATLLGSGKLSELRAWAAETGCDFVLLDRDLTASQHRNIESKLDCPVLDRTQLILDIFAKHARSREGRLQVELAQLDYLLPRLAGRGATMSRLGGGIGTRGPGETQLESDRRKIRRRIVRLRGDLKKVRLTRRLQRAKRTAVPIPTVALCGYTNAGKSTLFNALTRAGVLADSRLFATLDPTIRRLCLPSGRAGLVSDTVGFIRNLPPSLIQAFRATLEEVTEAALIVHVVDVSADSRSMHREEVNRVLEGLGARDKPQVLVLNKSDLISEKRLDQEVEREASRGSAVSVVGISARTGAGLEQLLREIDEILARGNVVRRRLRLPYSDGRVLAMLYDEACVLERRDGEAAVDLEVEMPIRLADQLRRYCRPGD